MQHLNINGNSIGASGVFPRRKEWKILYSLFDPKIEIVFFIGRYMLYIIHLAPAWMRRLVSAFPKFPTINVICCVRFQLKRALFGCFYLGVRLFLFMFFDKASSTSCALDPLSSFLSHTPFSPKHVVVWLISCARLP